MGVNRSPDVELNVKHHHIHVPQFYDDDEVEALLVLISFYAYEALYFRVVRPWLRTSGCASC